MSKKTFGKDTHQQFTENPVKHEVKGRTKRCHDDHPVLKIGKGQIVGGSCRHPRMGYDIYVGLDWEMAYHPLAFPWKENRVETIHYPIQDYRPPGEVTLFTEMVEWLCNQLQEGKKIHVGCIGGHGRTGILLSAIVAKMGITKDAIQWVREHHCKKAVESDEQVQYLMKNFGVTKVPGAKPHTAPAAGNGFATQGWSEPISKKPSYSHSDTTLDIRTKRTYTPTKSKKSIWREIV